MRADNLIDFSYNKTQCSGCNKEWNIFTWLVARMLKRIKYSRWQQLPSVTVEHKEKHFFHKCGSEISGSRIGA